MISNTVPPTDEMIAAAVIGITDNLKNRHPNIDFQRPSIVIDDVGDDNREITYSVFDGDALTTHWETSIRYTRDALWSEIYQALHEEFLHAFEGNHGHDD